MNICDSKRNLNTLSLLNFEIEPIVLNISLVFQHVGIQNLETGLWFSEWFKSKDSESGEADEISFSTNSSISEY
jgi:hypothetical protein